MDKDSWLLSDSLVKSSLAVFGRFLLGYLIIIATVLGIFFIVGVLAALVNLF